ncbi:MAG: type I restriction enzyme HsdR N-terminal domain-containing protein [Bacteroidales bacterium]|nr:type I restriction enzyme HsdR N-terminal domain-containing protein [Bacteroidales bacterium]
MAEKGTVWDPLRKKDVAFTPEERVRQWFIGVLAGHFSVPVHMMMSEVGFRLGGKRFRADIMVYDRNARPLMMVECKRPEVELSQEVVDQVIRYNMALNLKYIVITNGNRTCMFGLTEDGYRIMESLPHYEEMLK